MGEEDLKNLDKGQVILQQLRANKEIILVCWLVALAWIPILGQNVNNTGLILVFSWLIIPAAVLDYKYMMLYNRLLWPVFLIGVAVAMSINVFIPGYLLTNILGCLLFGSFMHFLRIISRGGMGLGDIKYAYAMGIWLNLEQVLVAIMLAYLLASLGSCLWVWWKGIKLSELGGCCIPFGPFIATGCVGSFLFSNQLLAWYVGWL